MGCCEGKNTNQGLDKDKIKQCIQTENLSLLKSFYKYAVHKDKDFDINKIRYQIDDNLIVSPLGLALLLGHANIFTAILRDMKGDLLLMESLFSQAGTTGLSVICLNNYLALLQVYLPLYLTNIKPSSNLQSRPNNTQTLNLDSHNPFEKSQTCLYTPIQLAVDNGYIGIVNFLKNYSYTISLLPPEIDLNYIDEASGNNCALISCNQNNYNMLKFLHSQCQADFTIINNYSENAINILAIGSFYNSTETFKCLEYIVEKIGIDILYNYQETLMMLEEEKSVSYIEKKLKDKGIHVTKKDLDEEGLVKPQKRTVCNDYDTGNKFTFTRLFPELLKSTKESVITSDNIAE
ncbi:hypothetical protein SteCoe_13715 [Stentor coeruleus]|uniref:Uncharacterized protein n=1 Tax=Stentor coeruleus TaxID=5963 RepID=A0A1R2C7X0_9CILI|nr:hypothetical protein SteCoe_13715 [Stentor coeruleus]